MKKIFNWTVGSFFRTIGRTIAFLVMGGLIYYIFTYNGFGIEDLFFDNVKASEIAQVEWYGDMWDSSGNKLSYNTHGFRSSFGNAQGSGGVISTHEVFFNSNHNASDGYTPPSGYDYVLIRAWLFSSIEYDIADMTGSFTFSINNQWPTRSACQIVSDSDIVLSNSNMLNKAWTIKCPIPKYFDKITSLALEYQFSTQGIFYFELDGAWTYMKEGSQAIIDNQDQNTQQIIEHQQQQHEEVMDSNTTEAEEEATGFFEDFEVPDAGGLSGVITAPLSTIQSLLNSTCTNLVLPLPFVNEDITLPCMNSIYTQHFGAFFTIYQTIILAIIAYRCIRSIFFDIHGFTDPNDDRIEVMDL